MPSIRLMLSGFSIFARTCTNGAAIGIKRIITHYRLSAILAAPKTASAGLHEEVPGGIMSKLRVAPRGPACLQNSNMQITGFVWPAMLNPRKEFILGQFALVIPSEVALQAERGISRVSPRILSLCARFLAPLVKARGFGMTLRRKGKKSRETLLNSAYESKNSHWATRSILQLHRCRHDRASAGRYAFEVCHILQMIEAVP